MESAIRNPQSTIANPADWLPLDQAAELLGDPLRTMRYRCTSQWAPAGLAELRPPAAGTGKPVWWVNRACHPRLSRCPDRQARDGRVRESLFANHPQHHVERAYRKAFWVNKWRKLIQNRDSHGADTRGPTELELAADIVAQARDLEGDSFKISVRSLQAWHRDSNKRDIDGTVLGVRALIDDYRGPGGMETQASRGALAIEFFYSLYHTQSRRSVRICHDTTLRETRRRGWPWPPAYTATTRWLRDDDDLALSCLMREGRSRWSHKYMPYLEMDWNAVEPGEFFVCDHTQCDFWVMHEDRLIRPWYTAVQDCRSRCIVGWHLGPAPHQDAIAASLRMAFADWAIPRVMRIDNGKDYTSKYITGLTKSKARSFKRELGKGWKDVIRRDLSLVGFDDRWLGITGELGIELIYAIPYAAWSKGTIERFFGTYHDQCGKDFVTYCGNSPTTRPECVDKLRRGVTGRTHKGLEVIDTSDVPTMAGARVRIGEYLERYHNATHRGVGVDGSTPLAVWRTAATLRRADHDALLFMMQVRGSYKVGPNGVALIIGGARITYGATNSALRRWKGRQVLVAVDPDQVGQCWALDPKGRGLIARCEANKRIHPCSTTEDVRNAVAKSQRAKAIMHKAARSAPARTRTMAQAIGAAHRERTTEIRATGTDAVDAVPNIMPVRTGFEGVSIPDRTAFQPPVDTAYSVDLDALELDLTPADDAEHESEYDADIPLGDPGEGSAHDPYANINLYDLDLTPDSEREDDG